MRKAATGFSVVAVLDDGPSLLRIGEVQAPDRGIISVLVRPNAKRSAWVGSDVVAALGKEGTVDRQRASNDAFAYAQAWLIAEETTDVIFLGAQCLRIADLKQILYLGVFAQVRMWLVFDSSMPEALHDLLLKWGAGQTTSQELRAQCAGIFQTVPVDDKEERGEEPFPQVPADDFLTFYAQARRELDEVEFARFDAVYRNAHEAASSWLRGAMDEDYVAQQLHELTSSASSTNEVLAILRATQAAVFNRGYLLKVNLRRFLARAERVGSLTQLSDGQWERLGRYAMPRLAVIGVLSALGLHTRQIAELKADEVTVDGSTVYVEGRSLPVPAPAQKYLVALHLLRMAAGMSGEESFVIDSERYRKPTPRTIARALTVLTRHTGIAFRGRSEPMDSGRMNWPQRWGLSLQRLTI